MALVVVSALVVTMVGGDLAISASGYFGGTIDHSDEIVDDDGY